LELTPHLTPKLTTELTVTKVNT